MLNLPRELRSKISESHNSEIQLFSDRSPILDGFLRREELAKELGCSARTIDRWHALREGPPRVQVGRTILYNIQSVRDWLRSREQQPPSMKNRRTLFPKDITRAIDH